jgi:hypothetical protein
MTDLAQIKAQLASVDANKRVRSLGPNLTRVYLDWLVAEVDRLRGLLGRLEWAGTHCERDREMAACPVCDVVADSEVVGQLPHLPGCELAEVLGRTQKGVPPSS